MEGEGDGEGDGEGEGEGEGVKVVLNTDTTFFVSFTAQHFL